MEAMVPPSLWPDIFFSLTHVPLNLLVVVVIFVVEQHWLAFDHSLGEMQIVGCSLISSFHPHSWYWNSFALSTRRATTFQALQCSDQSHAWDSYLSWTSTVTALLMMLLLLLMMMMMLLLLLFVFFFLEAPSIFKLLVTNQEKRGYFFYNIL